MQTLTRLDYTPDPCPTGKARKYTSEERQRWRTPNSIQQPVLWLVAHALGGEIGVDPTSDDARSVPAYRHITASDNCLGIGWSLPYAAPKTAFMNPPFDQPHIYLDALVTNIVTGHITEAVALLKIGTLANQNSGKIIRHFASSACLWGAGKEKANGRMAFIDCDGKAIKGSDFDTVLVHFGHGSLFRHAFQDYGTIITFQNH